MFETLGPVVYLAQCCNLYQLAKEYKYAKPHRNFADFLRHHYVSAK